MSTRRVIVLILGVLLLAFIVRVIFLIQANKNIRHTNTENDAYVLGVLTKDEKNYVVRCDKSLWDRHSSTYSKRISIIVNLLSSKDDIPSGAENKRLFKLEDRIIALLQKNKNTVYAGTITGGGKKEYFLYSKDFTKVTKQFIQIQHEFSQYKMKLTEQDDKNWIFYQSYCQKGQFPKTTK